MGLTSHLPMLAIILVIALMVFGPSKLPEMGSAVGKSIREFKHATAELGHSHDDHVQEYEPIHTAPTVVTDHISPSNGTVAQPSVEIADPRPHA